MVETNRVRPNFLRNLDAKLHQKEIISIFQSLDELGSKTIDRLGMNVTKGSTPTTYGYQYLQKGIIFIRSQNVFENEIRGEFAFISESCHSYMKRSEVSYGDVLLNIVGASIGRAAVFTSTEKANINQAVSVIRYNNQIDPFYLSSWINSSIMQKIIAAQQSGNARDNFDLYQVRDIEIPLPDKNTQTYIGDKVRQAEQLREWAIFLFANISGRFDFFVENPIPQKSSWRVPKEIIDSYRLNPKQYDPVVLDLLDRTQDAGICLQPLSELVGDREIAGGATPKGAQYYDDGIFFTRVQNVNPLRLDLSDAVFIDQATDDELRRSRCIAGDIILTITGYPGTASLVMEEDLPLNINQHSVRFNVKEGIGNGFVCAALNSRFLKYQVDRSAIGGTRDALDYPSVSRLLIPRFSPEVEQEINSHVFNVISALKIAQRLTTSAKFLVEALIEGQIDENLLISAQTQLQSGSDTLDRSILSRLKTDGMDGQGQPLFPDIDLLDIRNLLKT